MSLENKGSDSVQESESNDSSDKLLDISSEETSVPSGEASENTPEPQRPKKNRVRITLSPLALIGVIMGAMLGSGGGAAVGILALDGAAKRVSNSGEISINSVEDVNWVTAAAVKSSPSTLALLVTSPYNVTTGSGFVMDEEGHIVTSAHVITHESASPNNTKVQVKTWDGDIYNAEIVGVDLTTDVGVLRILDYVPGEIKPAVWGDSSTLQVGDPIIALGSPYDLLNTVTRGIISNPDRVIQLTSQQSPEKASSQMQFLGEEIPVENSVTVRVIQTDAAINPGNSGGPLVNKNGEVVGLVAAIAGGEYSRGLGFAIPSNNVKRIAENLASNGFNNNGFLGIIVTAAIPKNASDTGPSFFSGAEVVEVGIDTPADEAGIQTQDIIVSVDGTRVNSSTGLSSYIASQPPGAEVVLEVIRGEQERSITVILGERNN